MKARRRAGKLLRGRFVGVTLGRLRNKCAEITRSGRARPRVGLEALELQQTARSRLEREICHHGEVVVADADRHGWLSRIGPIPGVAWNSTRPHKIPRRMPVQLVATPEYLCVRKSFAGNKVGFVNEVEALHRLGSRGCNVPAILDLDFDSLTASLSFIPGPSLHEEIWKRLDAPQAFESIAGPPDLLSASSTRRLRAHLLEQGRSIIGDIVDDSFLGALVNQLHSFHRMGVFVHDLKWANIIIHGPDDPYWIDFDLSEIHARMSWESFQVLADLDIERFNRVFGTEILTHDRLRAVGGHGPAHH